MWSQLAQQSFLFYSEGEIRKLSWLDFSFFPFYTFFFKFYEDIVPNRTSISCLLELAIELTECAEHAALVRLLLEKGGPSILGSPVLDLGSREYTKFPLSYCFSVWQRLSYRGGLCGLLAVQCYTTGPG